ncbi:hypothetical protein ABIE24_002609 [Mycetocola sp. 2940]
MKRVGSTHTAHPEFESPIPRQNTRNAHRKRWAFLRAGAVKRVGLTHTAHPEFESPILRQNTRNAHRKRWAFLRAGAVKRVGLTHTAHPEFESPILRQNTRNAVGPFESTGNAVIRGIRSSFFVIRSRPPKGGYLFLAFMHQNEFRGGGAF